MYASPDQQYVNFFLIIYRRFARPYEVLCKLVERYDFVSAKLDSEPILAKYAHMKYACLYNFFGTRLMPEA